MDTIALVKGLRVARLDRVLDALAGRTAPMREPRNRRHRRRAAGQMPELGLRFLPTV